MTIHGKAVEQYFTVVLFVFQFYPVFNFGKFFSFGLGTVWSEWVKTHQGGHFHVRNSRASPIARLVMPFNLCRPAQLNLAVARYPTVRSIS